MKREDVDFIKETLVNAIDWAEYADDYFKEKYGLDQDKENVEKSIKLLDSFEKQLEDAKAQGFREAIKEMGKVKGL